MKKAILIFLLIITISKLNLLAQNCDNSTLVEANKKYLTGNFSEVIKSLTHCINNGFDDENKVQAYRLLSKTHLALDNDSLAIASAEEILKIDYGFQPDNLSDPPKFRMLIEALKESGQTLMITSVSKKAENIQEAPASVYVITDEDIKKRGYSDLEQLFDDVPGFDDSRNYGVFYSTISQRGYRSNNTERTLFLIDGVEENDLWLNAVYWSKQIPISNVKRVEIVYGPASTMYGANALVGVVNVITKEPNEIRNKKNVHCKFHGGYGTDNTRYGDLTFSVRKNEFSFSTTIRNYISDMHDLSEYKEFDYNPNDYNEVDYVNILSVDSANGAARKFIKDNNIAPDNPYFQIITNANGDTLRALCTDAGAQKARDLDKGLVTNYNGAPLKYSNYTENTYIYSKLKISNFNMGFETWASKAASMNYYHDNLIAPASTKAYWIPKNTFFYVRYDNKIGKKLFFTNFCQYRISSMDDDTKSMIIRNYSNRSLKATDLLTEKLPFLLPVYYYQISRQLRNELKFNYIYKILDIVGGFEVRYSDLHGNYRTTSLDTASVIEIGQSSSDNMPGGNSFTTYDVGTYLQVTIKILSKLNLTLGGRYDYNQIRVNGGYGSQFNPRVAVVATPGDFILKAIYAKAFQNASSWTKYATAVGVRELQNPTMKPEESNNYEIVLGYKILKGGYFEIDGYYSNYKSVAGTRYVPYKTGYTQQNDAFGKVRIYGMQANINYSYNSFTFFANYSYTNPQNYITDQYGEVLDSLEYVGGVANHRFNVGGNVFLFRGLNINLRMNYFGKRRVGKETTLKSNLSVFDPYVILNGAISYTYPKYKNITLQFVANNILNKKYFVPGPRTGDGATYASRTPQPEFNYMLKLIFELN